MATRIIAVLLIVGLQACSPSSPETIPLATPLATAAVAPTLIGTPSPIQLAPPYAMVKITPDGSVEIIAPDGTVTMTTLDAIPGRAFTGVSGTVSDGDGNPVAGAIILTVRPDGSPCLASEVAHVSGLTGRFEVPVDPGFCIIRAGRDRHVGEPVLAQVVKDHVTPVNLTSP